MYQLFSDCRVVKVSVAVVAGQTAVNSTHVDMTADQGFDAVMFIADLGTVVDACVLTLKAQQGALANDSDQADITGATTTAFTASGSSNTILVLDLNLPSKRYVRAVLTRTAQNATLNTILAILYRAKKRPTSVDASVLASMIAADVG